MQSTSLTKWGRSVFCAYPSGALDTDLNDQPRAACLQQVSVEATEWRNSTKGRLDSPHPYKVLPGQGGE